MTLLASTAPMLDGDFVMKALLLAVLVMQVVNGLMGWTRGKQAARRSVSFEGVPIEKEEFEKHCRANKEEHEQIFSRLGGSERGIRAEIKQDLGAIYVEINRLREDKAGIAEAVKGLSHQLAHYVAVQETMRKEDRR